MPHTHEKHPGESHLAVGSWESCRGRRLRLGSAGGRLHRPGERRRSALERRRIPPGQRHRYRVISLALRRSSVPAPARLQDSHGSFNLLTPLGSELWGLGSTLDPKALCQPTRILDLFLSPVPARPSHGFDDRSFWFRFGRPRVNPGSLACSRNSARLPSPARVLPLL